MTMIIKVPTLDTNIAIIVTLRFIYHRQKKNIALNKHVRKFSILFLFFSPPCDIFSDRESVVDTP